MVTATFEELACPYSLVIYKRLLQNFDVGCCIPATQVTKAVFTYFGYDVEVIPTIAAVYNATMAQRIEKGEKLVTDVEANRWSDEGCYSVILGLNPERNPNKIDSHLINIIRAEGKTWLLDASIQQAHRPAKGIKIPAAIIQEGAEKLVEEGTLTYESEDGFVLVYQTAEDQSYRTSPDWVSDRRWKGIAGEMIRMMKGKDA